MTYTKRTVLAGLACAALAACGSGADIKESLGLIREGPDEYRVVPRPPLSVPPEFNLRPPGAQQSDYVSGKPAQAKAHDDVLGIANTASQAPAADTAVTHVVSGSLPSGSDAQFLANIGAPQMDPQVRQKITDDRMNGMAASDPNYLFGGRKQADAVVDAPKEAARIKEVKAEGKPVTAGETPVVAPKDKGLLGDIF